MAPSSALALLPFLLLLLFSSILSNASSAEVRILVPLWLTDVGYNVSWDLEATQAEAASFALAVRHFNDRRADILPVLATVATCQKNLTLVKMCDDSGNPRRVSRLLEEFSGQYDIISGLASIAARDATSFVDATSNMAVLSHWASEDVLGDKTTYPWFSRTFISDRAMHSKIARFIAQVGYSNVAIVYVDQDTVPAVSKLLDSLLNELQVDAHSFPYVFDDVDSLEKALRRVKQTERNVIIYLGWADELVSDVPRIAHELGLDSDEKLWIFTPIDVYPSNDEIAADETLKSFLRGSLYFEFVNPNDTLARNFLNRFDTEFASDTSIVPFINARLPPSGAMNEYGGSCQNDALSMHLDPNYFTEVDRSTFGVAQLTAYDAIMAIGLAACTDQSSTMPADGEEFSELIRAVKFEGLSGRVEFTETGDRNESATTFTVSNWQLKEDGSLQLVPVGEYLTANDVWYFTDPDSIQLKAGAGLGALPGNFTTPYEVRNYLPDALRILGYFEVAVGLIACIGCLVWMFIHRDSPVIRASQPIFMATMVLGCMIVTTAILPLTTGDSPSNPIQGSTASCMAQSYMFFLGFSIILGSVVGKTLRAYFIYERRSLYHQRMKRRHVFAIVIGLICADLALLISMEKVAPFTWTRLTVAVDQRGGVLESRGECSFVVDSRSRGFFAGLVAIYGLSILAFRWASGLSKKRFVEERNASTALIQLFILVVPAIAAAFSFVIGRFVIISTYFLVSVFVVLVFAFLPKYLILREQSRHARVRAEIEKDKVENGAANNDVDVLDGLRIPMVQVKFERFAEENYVTESYLFVVDVIAFKEEFEKESFSWRATKANSIVNIYIEEGSLLQVNISDRCRNQTLERYKKSVAGRELLSEDLFDAALKEIAEMLNFGAWGQFVQEGGMYNVRNSLIPRSKVMGWFFTNPTHSNPHDAPASGNSISSGQGSDLGGSMLTKLPSVRMSDLSFTKRKSDLTSSSLGKKSDLATGKKSDLALKKSELTAPATPTNGV